MDERTHNHAAVALITIVLAGLGLHLWADVQANRYYGPVHLAVDGETVVASDSAGLVVLDSHTGRVISDIPFEKLNIPLPLADLQRLGNGDLLIAESESKTVWRCRMVVFSCERFASLDGVAGRFVKIHYDESLERLWVAATHGNKVRQLAPPFDRAHVVTEIGRLAAPNEIWVSPDGSLWVSNTDAGSVQEFAPESIGYEKTGRSLVGRNEFTSKRRPLDFAGDEQHGWWVLLSDLAYINKSLVSYWPNGSARQLIRLPDGAGAVAVEAHKDTAVVADIDGFALYRVSRDAGVSQFGDQAFLARMTALRTQNRRFRTASWAGIGVLGLGLVGVFVVAVRARKPNQPRATGGAEVPPLIAEMGIYWLTADPRLKRNLKQAGVIMLTLPVLLIVPLFFLPGGSDSAFLRMELMPWLVGMVMMSVALLLIFRRLLPDVGSGNETLYVRRGGKTASHAPQSEVRYSKNILWIGEEFVITRNGYGRPVYEPAHLEQHIESRLAPENRLGQAQMTFAMLRSGHLLTWFILILLIGSIVVFAFDYWPAG